jgi:uncharacterized membrane protein
MSALERRAPEGVLASAAMSAVQRRALQGVLASAEFRATTRWPSTPSCYSEMDQSGQDDCASFCGRLATQSWK